MTFAPRPKGAHFASRRSPGSGRRAGRVAASALALLLAGLVALGAVAVLWLHLSIRPVLSASMRPTFGPGAAVIARPVAVSTVKVGDILLFTPPGSTEVYAHRVVNVGGAADDPVITTKGDANPSPDPWRVHLNGRSAYVVVASVPWVGEAMAGRLAWLRPLLIAAAGLGVCWAGCRTILGGPADERPDPVASDGGEMVPA